MKPVDNEEAKVESKSQSQRYLVSGLVLVGTSLVL